MQTLHIHKYYKNCIVKFLTGYRCICLYSEDERMQQWDIREHAAKCEYFEITEFAFFGGEPKLTDIQRKIIKQLKSETQTNGN